MDRAIGEVLMARPRARQFEALVATSGPAMHHRVGHVRVKLETESVVELERFHREVAAFRQQLGPIRKFKSLAVPVVSRAKRRRCV
jgi:hypothetical protein